MDFIPVAKVEAIPPGDRKRFDWFGERITIFHIGSAFYAIADTCPHKKTAPLFRGNLNGLRIHCPNHGYGFDLKTGSCNVSPEWNTRVFPVKVEDGEIRVGRHPEVPEA